MQQGRLLLVLVQGQHHLLPQHRANHQPAHRLRLRLQEDQAQEQVQGQGLQARLHQRLKLSQQHSQVVLGWVYPACQQCC